MDLRSPLSPAQITKTADRLRALVSQTIAVEEARVVVMVAKMAKPPKGAMYAYDVQVRIDGAPPTDAQNAPLASLIRSTLDDAVRWASAN